MVIYDTVKLITKLTDTYEGAAITVVYSFSAWCPIEGHIQVCLSTCGLLVSTRH